MATPPKTPRGLPLSGLFVRKDPRDDALYFSQQRGLIFSICLLLASFLWFSFAVQEQYTTYIELPTSVTGVPADQVLLNEPPETVRLQVSGEGIQLIQLTYNPPVLVIDGREDEVEIQSVVPELAQNVALLSVQPQRLVLQKEDIATRRVPIESNVTFVPASSHQLLRSPELSPDSVTISGPLSIIQDIDIWATEALTVSDVRGTLAVDVALSDTLAPQVTVDLSHINVRADASQFTEVVRSLTVEVDGAPTDNQVVSLDPPVVEVRFLVQLDLLPIAENSQELRAVVAFNSLFTDTSGQATPEIRWPLALVPTQSIRNIRVVPRTLRYYNLVMDP